MAAAVSRAPDDALELKIVLLWEDILGEPTVNVDDNFFDIGGSSLLAIAMIAKLGSALGTKLRLADLFTGPTPQELAAHIRANGQMRESCIYRLNANTHKRTLYCVHAISGSPISYLPLARTLDTEVSIFGVQSVGLDSDEMPASRIQEMASVYAAELASRQADRTYFLLGWSFGAYVAFEMAVALAKRDLAPQRVILVDPPMKEPVIRRDDESDGKDELERLAPDFWNLPVDRAVYDKLDAEGRLAYVIRLALEHGAVSPLISEETVRRRMDVRRANFAAAAAYTPSEVYDGTLFVINAVDQDGIEETRTYWRALAAGGVEFSEVPGAHYDVFQERALQAVRTRVDELLQAP